MEHSIGLVIDALDSLEIGFLGIEDEALQAEAFLSLENLRT